MAARKKTCPRQRRVKRVPALAPGCAPGQRRKGVDGRMYRSTPHETAGGRSYRWLLDGPAKEKSSQRTRTTCPTPRTSPNQILFNAMDAASDLMIKHKIDQDTGVMYVSDVQYALENDIPIPYLHMKWRKVRTPLLSASIFNVGQMGAGSDGMYIVETTEPGGRYRKQWVRM